MKSKKGSGILIVILSTIVIIVYSLSVYSEQEHFEYIQKKYTDSIVNYYEKDLENIDEIYDELMQIHRYNQIISE